MIEERGEQIQRVLTALAKHADVVAEAFDGAVESGDKARNSAIDALYAVGALKPYDEGSYRLNPRLREFLADHFASYHAFQALRRISGVNAQAQEQWRELVRLKSRGAVRDVERLFAALDDSVVEMAYSIDHNLSMLHALISTQYGNVEELSSKLSQNRYYARQVEQFLRDVEAIDAFVDRVAEEAIAFGLPDARTLVTRRLGSRLLQWTAQIKDAQAVISKRLFEAKLMEARAQRLSRVALWLKRSRTANGWDLHVDESFDIAMLRPEGLALRAQPDVADRDEVVWQGLMAAVARLPPSRPKAAAPVDAEPQYLVEDEDAVVDQESVEERALNELVDWARTSAHPTSVLEWKREREGLLAIPDGAWLMYAYTQLRGRGVPALLAVAAQEHSIAINEPFHDVFLPAHCVVQGD